MYCKNCSITLSTKNQKKFCSQSCAASYNNRGKSRRSSKNWKPCLCGCDKETKGKFYSVQCQNDYKYQTFILEWKLGKHRVCASVEGKIPEPIRRYIKEKCGNKCQKCGWSEVNPITQKIPLHINHINGDWQDNSEENLELLCPNCHALTETFGILNKGFGRRFFREQYYKEKRAKV